MELKDFFAPKFIDFFFAYVLKLSKKKLSRKFQIYLVIFCFRFPFQNLPKRMQKKNLKKKFVRRQDF